MEENLNFPSWDPAKETLQEHLDRIKNETERAAAIPVDQLSRSVDGASMDQWDLLDNLYSLDNWKMMTIMALDRLNKEFHQRNLKAAMRLARRH